MTPSPGVYIDIPTITSVGELQIIGHALFLIYSKIRIALWGSCIAFLGIKISVLISQFQRKKFGQIRHSIIEISLLFKGLAWKTHAEFLHSVNFQPMWPCLVLKGAYFHAGYDKISFRLIQSRFAELRAKDIFARGLFRASRKVRVGVTCKLCIERYYLPLLNAT